MFKSFAHNIDDQQRTNDVYVSENVDFAGMLLSQDILNGLNSAGFKKPSPIQLKAIPLAMCGFDLIVQSKSGTGKTAVFSIVALQSISIQIKDPQVLILTPTREIAVQIQHVLNTIGSEIKDFNAEYFIGGLPIAEDKQKLSSKSIHVAIGAPGRIKNLIENKHLKTKKIKLFILDEADKLMFESFKDDIDFINKSLPQSKQIIATSATYPDELHNLVAQYMKSPTKISVETDIPTLLGLKQFVSLVPHHLNIVRQIQYKTNELTRILSTVPFKQCIVFTNYQIRAESLSSDLNKTGWPSTFISASQTQDQRLKALKKLKNHECRLLISTDLIARGIDAENVNLVINYDIPYDGATYLHRIGRAGRYGSLGLCITICCNGDEYTKFKNLISTISTDIELLKLPTNETMPPNLWKCDKTNLEKVSFNESLKENTFEFNEGSSKTYQIQSDNIFKISDLQREFDINSLVDSQLKSTNIQQDKGNKANLEKKSIESVINEEESSNFGTPMLQDLSSTPQALAIQKEKHLIQEKNVALLSIASLLVNNNVDSKFQPFKYFENLISNKDIKLKSVNSTEELNCSQPIHLKNCDVNGDGNKNNQQQKFLLEKVPSATKENGFKSFADLKTSFVSRQNINVIQNENSMNEVQTKDFKANEVQTNDSRLAEIVSFDSFEEEKLDVNRNDNNSQNKTELEKPSNKTLENGFKSFAELKTSLAGRQNIDAVENENIMETVETKGFKGMKNITNDLTFTTIANFGSTESKETPNLNVNQNSKYSPEKFDLGKMNNKTIENGLKSFNELKTSVFNRQNILNGNIMDKVESKRFKSFEDLKHLHYEQNNSNEMLKQETKPVPINLKENFNGKSQQNSNLNSKPETTNVDEKQTIDQSISTNDDGENVLIEQELSFNAKIVNNVNSKVKLIRNTKIDGNIISKLSYLLSLLRTDKEIYHENKAKLKKVNYKIILDALLNNKPLTLENLTKQNDFVRIIESKVVIDSNSTKSSYCKISDRSKSIDNVTQSESLSHISKNVLQNSATENLGSKSNNSKFYYNATQENDQEYYYSQGYNNPDIHYSNNEYNLNNVSRLSACPTCECTCNTVRDNANYLQQSSYNQSQETSCHQANNNSSFYSSNNYYTNSWYNMWREQILHVRNHVQQTIYMREMKKYTQ